MLNGLRKAGKSFIGRIIADGHVRYPDRQLRDLGHRRHLPRRTPQNVVAKVGRTDISYDQFRNAYNTEIQRLNRQFRTNLTPELARSFGLDRQVLSRLI